MDWNNWLNVLRWRALEETDPKGSLASLERRQEATIKTRGGLTSESVSPTGINDREIFFLGKRADWLEQELLGFRGPLVHTWRQLKVVTGRWSLALIGWGLALFLGYVLTHLGQGSEFNLLSLPLVSVLLWNALVMVFALLLEWLPTKDSNERSFSQWLMSLAEHPLRESTGETESGLTRAVVDKFHRWATPLAWSRQQRRMRAWLHIGAALVAVGSCVSLYAHGWSKEYRAVWESTLLNAPQTEAFVSRLFTPAAEVFHLTIPREQIAGMQQTGGKPAVSPSPALPWIHLYAGTLLLLVAVPRVLLAGLTLARSGQVWQRSMRKLEWAPYLALTLRAVEGTSEQVTLLAHAMEPSEAKLELWNRGARGRFGVPIETLFRRIAHGEEDEFAKTWQPQCPRAVLVFNLATTPEAEVQRFLVNALSKRLRARFPEAELMVLLDATSTTGKWTESKLQSRERLWTEVLRDTGAEILVATRKAGVSLTAPLPSPSE